MTECNENWADNEYNITREYIKNKIKNEINLLKKIMKRVPIANRF